MLTQATGTNIFSRLKNAFVSSEELTQTETLMAVVTDVEEAEYPVKSSQKEEESITKREIALRTVPVSAPQAPRPDKKDLDIRFATKFIQSGGKFIFCESIREAIYGIRMLKEEQGWAHVFCWENEIKDAFAENNFQKGAIGYTIENSDAAISLCELLVADEGIVILNPKQASRRRLPCFPKTHIIITDVSHLTASEAEGLEIFHKMHKGELPSIVKLDACNKGHFYDKKRLILNAEGPENVYIFLIDEIIPPSLRP
ncbi:MAG: LUD domain-containing protein [Bacteroidetes bacterium]|nr:LUD domain-containing protein [Bacteroidota bacterium]